MAKIKGSQPLLRMYIIKSGASRDDVLSSAFKCCSELYAVLLKLGRFIFGCAIKKLFCTIILGELEAFRI